MTPLASSITWARYFCQSMQPYLYCCCCFSLVRLRMPGKFDQQLTICRVKKAHNVVFRELFFASTLTFIIEAYIELSLASVLQIMNPITKSYGDILCLVFSYLTLILVCVTPFVLAFVIRKNQKRLEDQQHAQYYGDSLQNISKCDMTTLSFYPVYMLRRFLFVLLVIFVTNYGFLQVQLMILMSCFYLIYIGWIRPMVNRSLNRNEFLNEICILIAAILLPVLTDMVDSPYVKYNIGWILIGLIVFNFGANFLLIFYEKSRQLYFAIRKLIRWIRMKLRKPAKRFNHDKSKPKDSFLKDQVRLTIIQEEEEEVKEERVKVMSIEQKSLDDSQISVNKSGTSLRSKRGLDFISPNNQFEEVKSPGTVAPLSTFLGMKRSKDLQSPKIGSNMLFKGIEEGSSSKAKDESNKSLFFSSAVKKIKRIPSKMWHYASSKALESIISSQNASNGDIQNSSIPSLVKNVFYNKPQNEEDVQMEDFSVSEDQSSFQEDIPDNRSQKNLLQENHQWYSQRSHRASPAASERKGNPLLLKQQAKINENLQINKIGSSLFKKRKEPRGNMSANNFRDLMF